MRFFKAFSVIVVLLIILLIATYAARVAVINTIAAQQLSLANIKVTCIAFNLTSTMNIVIEKLCLASPKADIEIVDSKVQWQYSPEFRITDIDVTQAKVIGTEHFFSDISNRTENDSDDPENINQLLTFILQPYIKQISQLNLPMSIKLNELSYSPFRNVSQSSTQRQQYDKVTYKASLSATNKRISFSLKNADGTEFIKAKLDQDNDKNFIIVFRSKLDLLKDFILVHQLPITAALRSMVSSNKISGDINTVITYHSDKLSIHNQMTNLTLSSERGINNSGPFELNGVLNFHSQLPLAVNKTLSHANNEITVNFIERNAITLNYSQAHLVSMLEKNQASPTLMTMLKANPVNSLTITLANNTMANLSNKHINLSEVKVKAAGDEREHLVVLSKVTLSLPKNDLSIASFTLDSDVKLADIASVTPTPLAVHLAGALQKIGPEITLKLTKNSIVTATNIALTANKALPATSKKAMKRVSLKSISSRFEGNVQLLDNKIVNMNVKAHSQASRIKIPKTLQIKSFQLISEIKGNLDDISINTTANADGVNLGSIAISGPALAPSIKITAKDLQLTDLLALDMQLPTKIALIDGLLNYSVSGQIAHLNDIKNTPLSASFAVTSVSGDIDGIWLQELNWHQDFTLLAGKITTTPNPEENLTVELIETATPISKLSINTGWSFNKSFAFSASKLKADVLGGSFSVAKLQWPFQQGHSVNIQLDSIDLEQVLALDKKQGIVVTGDISGQLPVTFDGEKYIITDGELHNISNGLIQVIDNPAVAELKASNSQLQLAFDALQNLHYHQLSSEVSMADDGYMLLETVIKGRNPDIDNDVNLNLNLSYDLLGLLESLSITQRFEESIIKGLQKNKE